MPLLLPSLGPPPFLTFFSCIPSLSLFLSNSYLFSNLPQEISTLIGSQQNKKERKTQYLKDEYLGESISLLMSWFQSGLFALYMSIITIHLRTAVLPLKQRFLTALQTLYLSTCGEEESSSIPSIQRGTPGHSASHAFRAVGWLSCKVSSPITHIFLPSMPAVPVLKTSPPLPLSPHGCSRVRQQESVAPGGWINNMVRNWGTVAKQRCCIALSHGWLEEHHPILSDPIALSG